VHLRDDVHFSREQPVRELPEPDLHARRRDPVRGLSVDRDGVRRGPRSFPTRRSSDLSPPVCRSRRGSSRDLPPAAARRAVPAESDRKSTRLNSSHDQISYAVFCLKKKKKKT